MSAEGTPENDATLLTAVAVRGDRDAFAELHRRYESQAFNLAYRITCDRELATEALQEAMLRLWRSARAWQQTGAVRSWVMKLVARESLMVLRSMRRDRALGQRVAAHPETRRQQSNVLQPEDLEALTLLRGLLDRLPGEERQLLALYYGGDLSQTEIARQLKLPQTTVSHRLKRALEGLRQELGVVGLTATALTPGLLTRALCEGEAAPETAAWLFEQIRHLPQAKAPWLASMLPWTLGVAGVLALAAGLYALGQPGTTASAEPVHAVAPADATEPPTTRKKLSRQWTFEKIPSDIEVLHGTPRFDSIKGVYSLIPKSLILCPQVHEWPVAVHLTLYLADSTDNELSNSAFKWISGENFVSCRQWQTTTVNVGNTIDWSKPSRHEAWIVDHYLITGSLDRVLNITEFESRGDGRLIQFLQGMAISRLEAEELTSAEAARLRDLCARLVKQHEKQVGPWEGRIPYKQTKLK